MTIKPRNKEGRNMKLDFRKEEELDRMAVDLVGGYFRYLKEEESDERGNPIKKEPATRNQVEGLRMAFGQRGMQIWILLASRQLAKRSVQDSVGLKNFWKTAAEAAKKVAEKVKSLPAEEADALTWAFIESFCCDYYCRLRALAELRRKTEGGGK